MITMLKVSLGFGVLHQKGERRRIQPPEALAPSFMPPLADAMQSISAWSRGAEMMEEDATTVCGARHRRHGDRRGYRWGRTHSEIGYHGGKVKVARPRVRDRAQRGELGRARPDGAERVDQQVPPRGCARGRPGESAGEKMKAWLASDLSELGVIQIRFMSATVLMAAASMATATSMSCRGRGGDGEHGRRPGLDRQSPRQGARSDAAAAVHRPDSAIRNTFGVAAAIQRASTSNIIRLPQHLHASVKKAPKASKAECDLVRRSCVRQHPGGAILPLPPACSHELPRPFAR